MGSETKMASTSNGPVGESVDDLTCCSVLCQYTKEDKQRCIARGMKFGKFSAAEDQQIRDNWDSYAKSNDLNNEDILKYVGLEKGNVDRSGESIRALRKDTDFYTSLATGIKRPLYDVYQRARKIFHPSFQNGFKFTAQLDRKLLKLVEIHQKKWIPIAEAMDRTPTACVNRYFQLRKPSVKTFTPEIEEKLCDVVESLTKVGRSDFWRLSSDDVDWAVVAKELPGEFYPSDLKIHWAFVTKRESHPEDPKYRKLKHFSYGRVIEEVMKQKGVESERDVDWGRVASEFVNADAAVVLKCFQRAKAKRLKPKHLKRPFQSMLRKLGRKLKKHPIKSRKMRRDELNRSESSNETIDRDQDNDHIEAHESTLKTELVNTPSPEAATCTTVSLRFRHHV